MGKKKGLTVGRSNIWYMFRNPIYCGKIFILAYKNEEAAIVKGLHQALVSVELFNEVQDVLAGRKRKIQSQLTAKDEFPLRGFLQCRKCGGRLTASISKGNGGHYFYYHCITTCGERFNALEANSLFVNKLKKISANQQSITLFKEVMKDYCKQTGKEKNSLTKEITEAIEKNRLRIQNAQQMMVDGELSSADYKDVKSRYEPEIEKLVSKQLQVKQQDSNLLEHVTNATELLQNLAE